MILRPYQLDAIARVRSELAAGHRAVCLVLPTGGGKTAIASEITKLSVSRGHRVLFIAHRAELVDQAASTIGRRGLVVGGISASATTPPNPFAPVQVATIQTLLARGLRPPADVVIFDECHHAAAEEFAALLRDYPNAFLVGLTATPERGDGLGLGKSFKQLVVGTTVRDLTASGHLVPCEILRPERQLGPNELAQSPVDAYLEHASDRLTLVFARNIDLANEYTAAFRAKDIDARCVYGETPWSERAAVIAAFRERRIPVLVNVQVLTEGFDAPETSCAILARGCGTAGLYLQIVGRILRSAPGKRDALLIDLRGVSHELGRPEDERVYSLDGRGIRSKDESVYCPVCGSLREPGEGCVSCGWQPSIEPSKPDSILSVPLVKYAKKRAEGDEDRAKTLTRWLIDARAHGYKPGWAFAKFKAVYGAPPSIEIRQNAYRGSREVA